MSTVSAVSVLGALHDAGQGYVNNIPDDLLPAVTVVAGHLAGLGEWAHGEPEHLVRRVFGSLPDGRFKDLVETSIGLGYIHTRLTHAGGMRFARFVLTDELRRVVRVHTRVA